MYTTLIKNSHLRKHVKYEQPHKATMPVCGANPCASERSQEINIRMQSNGKKDAEKIPPERQSGYL